MDAQQISTTTFTIFESVNCDWCNFWVSEWGNKLWLMYNKNDNRNYINSIKENSMCIKMILIVLKKIQCACMWTT